MSALRVSFAGRSVTVEIHGTESLVRLVHGLFAAVPSLPGARDPHVHLSVHTAGRGAIGVEGGQRIGFPDDGSAAEWVMGRVIHHLADRATDGLFVHGAAVGPADATVVVGGASGAGKTTLTAWLVAVLGLAYRTDEVGFVDPDRVLWPFGRPFNAKSSGWPVLEPLATGGRPEADLVWDHGRMLAPERFGPVAEPGPCRPGVLLFPTFDPGADRASWRSLSSAEAAARLVGCTVNARNLPAGGLRLAAQVASSCRGWTLRYGGFSQLDPQDLQERLGRTGPVTEPG